MELSFAGRGKEDVVPGTLDLLFGESIHGLECFLMPVKG